MNGTSYRLKQSRRKRTPSAIPNAPRGRRAGSATLQRPFYPEIPQRSSYLLAYFCSATLAWFGSATWL